MIASDLIFPGMPTLELRDSLRHASELFAEHCITHLPIVQGDKFEGILPADAVLHLPDKDMTPIEECRQDFIPVFANGMIPSMDAFEILAKNELSILPITDSNYNYLGCIRADDLFFKVSNYYSFKEPGGIIVLSIGIRDYSLSEIARMVENENAKIIVLYMDMNPAMDNITLTLKINQLDISNVLLTMERFSYNILFSYPSNKRDDIWKDRYDQLMKMLDI